eukprot:COSAG01_NODE_4778_length_4749_cov_231.390108_7_plen_97_part_00
MSSHSNPHVSIVLYSNTLLAVAIAGQWPQSEEPLGKSGKVALSRRFRPQFRDKNRRDIGKSQSKWTAYKMKTPGSPPRVHLPQAFPLRYFTRRQSI